jgi:branched-chain amino acid aminotransferase
MPITETELVWRNGRLIPWEQATIHALSHTVHYGSSVFEGIRCYSTPQGPAIFRLGEHLRRFLDSARIYRMHVPYSLEALVTACDETVHRNGLESAYVRPLALRGYGIVGVDPTDAPIEVFVFAWPWGTYLGEGALRDGVEVCVSSWQRPAPDTYPALAKASGNYLNSQLMRMEARANGYAEAIALDTRGYVSEGSGENLFLVREGSVYTPPLAASILPGITRDTVITLAREQGRTVIETDLPREALYTADELFFTGTAAEVTPIRSVDRIPIGTGRPGPVTRALQDAYLACVSGGVEDTHGWLHPVSGPSATAQRRPGRTARATSPRPPTR